MELPSSIYIAYAPYCASYSFSIIVCTPQALTHHPAALSYLIVENLQTVVCAYGVSGVAIREP